MKKYIIALLSLCTLTPLQIEAACPATTLIVPRSVGANAARELAGLTNHICIFDMEKFYGTFAVTPEYTRSFNEDHLRRCLFGDSLACDCDTIKISGSQVQNRGSKDWLADNFGLPTDFESCVSFKPRVSNFLVDFYLYLGLDEWLCGLFFFLHTPVVNTRWDLNFCECDVTSGSNPYPTGYFASEAVPRSRLRNCFQEYVTDCNGIDLGNDILIEPLRFARMCPESKRDTALADIRFSLGWNFFQDEDYHLGIGMLAAAPTGTRPDGELLFEPLIGNGHHWELGGLLWGHVVFWRSECEEKFFAGWMQANITHMFKTRQCRFFDIKCKPNSRYMLAERMDTPVELLLGNEMPGTIVDSTVPDNQFKSLYAPVANLTRQEVDVSVGVQADIVAMLTYTSCGFTWDLGYNFWARTCQKITPNCNCPPRLENEKWALKGDAYTFGFTNGDINGTPEDSPVALSATQSNATIHRGTNVTTTIDAITVAPNRNPVVDNRQWAVAGENQEATVLLLNQPSGDQTGTSVNPVLLSECDIDYDGARTQGLSQKVFTHFSYSWLDNEDWTPYFGVGAEVEFAQDSRKCKDEFCNLNPCSSSCDTVCTQPTTCFTCEEDGCQRCALSQWGVWLKGGVSFN